jgi:hypothetical protein
MIEYKMNRPDAYNAPSHMDIGTFNDSYMKNKGVWPEERKKSQVKMRSTSKRNLTDSKRAKSPHSRSKISSPGGYSQDEADLNDFVS